MNIGEASSRSGLPAKTIRYYEELGLVVPDRRPNGYRDYSDKHVHKLRFLQRARRFDFSVAECRQLLSLYEDQDRSSADVKAIAEHHLEDLDRKLGELRELRETLAALVACCPGDNRPDCPILSGLGRPDQDRETL
ncbi:Cu(I)-responsive transcriptional regulator [Coralliovum pocilloporae]|uniref:Cu(I)-responsive transcriptional regulator n=1 Tax=Coralliovum pocilloporae TaxID=3066369 RepID=UPI0033077F33